MNIFFITTKLNFRTSGGSIEEFDLIMRTWQKLGNKVIAVTAFSRLNDIPFALPYKVIEENILEKDLLGIQKSVFKILRKYSKVADFFHIDGHAFLYGAGLYRRLGGQVPVSAFFNRELGCFPEDNSSLFPSQKISWLKKVKREFRRFLEKYIGMPIANGIDIFSFISPQYKAMYEEFGLAKRKNSLVIGDPIDFKKIMIEGGVKESSYLNRNKKSGPIILFYSSRMAPGKGFDMLLMAFSRVKNKDDFRLILGGRGPEEPYVRQMVRDFKLEKHVQLTGWVSKEKLYNLHKEADIFVQADWRPEGTSISLLYAMAFGLPSILPAGGGLSWQAKNSALYFRYRDCDDLAEKIEQLGKDCKLREELSRNCFLRLNEDEMNYEKQAGRLCEEMVKILQKP